VVSHYTPSVVSLILQHSLLFVTAVTGSFHSIACAANSRGVYDSLQVNYNFRYNMKPSTHVSINVSIKDNAGNTGSDCMH